jgi:hypothetical protein
MSRPLAEEQGARARRARRQERRRRHLVALGTAAVETMLAAHAAGVETLGELESERNVFEQAARRVIDEHHNGRLTAADLESLGLREDPEGGIWIRVGLRSGGAERCLGSRA